MYRKIIVFIISLSLITLCFAVALAEGIDDSEEGLGANRYQYVSYLSTKLKISRGKANITINVKGFENTTTQIKTTATLQKKSGTSWINVKSWSKTTTDHVLVLTKSKNVSNGMYRVKNVTKAYHGNAYETITDYSSIVTKN